MDKLDRQLKEMGCPYEASDFRASVWLEGYKAGINAGYDKAGNIVEQVFGGAK